MPLIKCPDCGKEFSDSAVACPNCGRPHKQVQPVEIRKKQGCFATGCLAVIVLFVVIAVSQQGSHPSHAATDPAVAPFVGKTAPAGAAAAAPDRWQVSRDVSKMDDSKAVTLSLEATGEITGWLHTGVPTLTVRCDEHKTAVYIDVGMASNPELGEYNTATVRLRFDAHSPTSQHWSESTDHEALFAPEPISLARHLASTQAFRFGFTPFNANPVTAEFDVRSLGAHLPEVAQACGWSL